VFFSGKFFGGVQHFGAWDYHIVRYST